MSEISIKVDGRVLSISADQKPTQIFAEDKNIVVCKINGVLRDLWTDLSEGDAVEGISISSPDGLAVLRHSTAHVMALAVQGGGNLGLAMSGHHQLAGALAGGHHLGSPRLVVVAFIKR